MNKIFFSLIFALLALSVHAQNQVIRSGEIWPDTDGKHINAHGGGILQFGDTYYWFGEHKSDHTSDALVGVTSYASKDLVNWRNCGVALSVTDQKGHDIERGCILERPKVIYNAKTGKFCMWFHLELKGRGYNAARFGVAVADRPEGPYEFLYSGRANAGKWPVDFDAEALSKVDTLDADHFKTWWTPDWYRAVAEGLFVKRDFQGGQMSRDMTLYVDDDGKAYHIFSSEDNLTLHIAELTDDYLHHSGRYTRVAPAGHNEAPAIFKRNGTYWMITSGCTGWAPNAARMFSASSIWGPWTQHPNPCIGPNADKTFGGQSTFILPLGNDQYLFMADIWRPKHPSDARYIWLPIEFEGETPKLIWRDAWNLEMSSWLFLDEEPLFRSEKPTEKTVKVPYSAKIIQDQFYIKKVKKQKYKYVHKDAKMPKYHIAVYAELDGEMYKIVGEPDSLIETLKKHHSYKMSIKRFYPMPGEMYNCLIGNVNGIPVEINKGLWELYTLVNIFDTIAVR